MEKDKRPATVIRVEDVSRVFHVGARQVPALQAVSLQVRPGTLLALHGRSGSGKTTLLNCIGGLDRPTNGRIWLGKQDITALNERQRVRLRRRHIGFVFQSYALLPTYSAYENVDLLLRLAGLPRRERQARAAEVLRQVGLEKWRDHRPHELSGGQQQRVAIARAIAPRPAILLADEPTGNLDTTTGRHIWQLFRQLANDGTTVLIATHDPAVKAVADQIIYLEDGRGSAVDRRVAD